jgi:hypothetical protein
MRARAADFVSFWLMDKGSERNVRRRPGHVPARRGKRRVAFRRYALCGKNLGGDDLLTFRVGRRIAGQINDKMEQANGRDPVNIVLEPFARSAIESRFGSDLNRGAQSALRHYARRVRSRRRPPVVPKFMRGGPVDHSMATELDLPVPYEVSAILRREARLQRVSVDRIVAHAIYVYLADMETGTVTEEAEEEARYTVHVPRHSHSAARGRGSASPRGQLRGRVRGPGGRSRFGRR